QTLLHLDVECPVIRQGRSRQLGAHQGRREESVDGLAAECFGNPCRLLEAALGEAGTGVRGVELAKNVCRRLAVAYEEEAHQLSLRDQAVGQTFHPGPLGMGRLRWNASATERARRSAASFSTCPMCPRTHSKV